MQFSKEHLQQVLGFIHKDNQFEIPLDRFLDSHLPEIKKNKSCYNLWYADNVSKHNLKPKEKNAQMGKIWKKESQEIKDKYKALANQLIQTTIDFQQIKQIFQQISSEYSLSNIDSYLKYFNSFYIENTNTTNTTNTTLFEKVNLCLPNGLPRTSNRPSVSGTQYYWKPNPNGRNKDKPGRNIGVLCETIQFGKVRHKYYKKETGRINNSKYDTIFPDLYLALKEYITNAAPWFTFTSICLNHNLECIPHTDTCNIGGSIIVGFGDYTKGEFCTEESEHNIKNNPLYFLGYKTLHWNKNWEGDRWTAIFYSI